MHFPTHNLLLILRERERGGSCHIICAMCFWFVSNYLMLGGIALVTYPMVHFFSLPFLSPFCQPWSQFFFSPNLCFSFLGNFIFSPAPTYFLFVVFSFPFFFLNFSRPPTYYPPLSATNLLTYIFKLKVDSSPSTYSPIIYFFTYQHFR